MILLVAVLFPMMTFAKGFVPSSFSAKFEQTSVSTLSKKELKSIGKIDYKYPGHIRFEIITPTASLFVSNPQKSWHYQFPFVKNEPGQVTIQKSSNMVLTKFLDSIKNGVEGSKLFSNKYEGKDLVLTFAPPIQKEMDLKQVILHSNRDAKSVQKLNDFDHMTLVHMDGKKASIKFVDLKEEVSFPPKHFEFQIPPNTKISN